MEIKTVIQTAARIPLGFLMERDNDIVAYTMSQIPLAKYDKRTGCTMTMANVIVARGNILSSYLVG